MTYKAPPPVVDWQRGDCLKIRWKVLAISLLAALAAGGLGALLGGGMERYASLEQPPLSPPGWLFPLVWTLLYLMMGAAAARVYCLSAPEEEKRGALRLYAAQLAANALWPGLFFGLGLYWGAAAWLAALLALVVWTALRFKRLDDLAGLLLAPYALWCAFALYLNLGVAALN